MKDEFLQTRIPEEISDINLLLSEIQKFDVKQEYDAEFHQKFIDLYYQLRHASLRNINANQWNADALNLIWEKFLNSESQDDDRLGTVQALLNNNTISSEIARNLESKNLLRHPDRVKVEVHVPHESSRGEWMAGGSWLICDDYLPYIINYPSGNPFKDLSEGTFSLQLDKFTPVLPDNEFPRGRLGMITFTDRIHVLYANTPVVGTSQDSRGVLMPGIYYATNAKDPLHAAWTPGLDANLGAIVSLFKQYQLTGNDPTNRRL